MTVSYVGGATAEADSVTLPWHQAGDLIVILALNGGSTTFPTPPSGWLMHSSRASTTPNLAMAIGFNVASSNA